jgi:fibronectin-binding autotransporter adhesin
MAMAHRGSKPQVCSGKTSGQTRSNSKLACIALAAAGASLLMGWAVDSVHAQDNWQGNTSVNWGDGGNWSPAVNAPPASGDSLIFGAAGSSGTTLTDNLMTPGSYSVAGITFNGPDAFVINPSTSGTSGFTLSGSITNNGTSLETINDVIALPGVQTISTNSGGGNITLGGMISGSGGIATTGPGVVTLSASDTYTGNTTIGQGTAIVSGSLYGSDVNSATVSIAAGAILNATSTANNVIGKGANATWVIAGTLNQSTGATLTLPGNVYLVNGGILTSGPTNTSGYGAYYGGSANYPTTITANGSGNAITSVNIGLAQSLTLATPLSTDSLTASSAFNDKNFVSSILKTGLGTLTMSGASGYTGTTNVSAGTMIVSGTLYSDALSSGTVVVASGATLNITSAANNAISYGGSASWIVSGTLNQSNSTHVSTMPGNIILNGGTLTSSTANTSSYGAFLGGNLGVQAPGYATTITANGPVNTISAVNFGVGGLLTINTPLSTDALSSSTDFFDRSLGSITKTGLGTLTLTGASTYSGSTNVSAGALVLTSTLSSSGISVGSGATLNVSTGANNALGFGSAATWAISGTLIESNTTHVLTIPGNINLSGGTLASGATDTSGYGAFLGGASNQGYATTINASGSGNSISAINFGVTGALTLSTPLATDVLSASTAFIDRGSGKIVKTGLGTLVLSGSDTYTAGTNISSGTLQFAKTYAVPASGTVTVASGATLAVNAGGTGEFTTGTTGAGSIGGILGATFASGSFLGIDTTNETAPLTYTGNITTAGLGLTKLGTGSLTLSGNNTYSGNTNVANGTLVVASYLYGDGQSSTTTSIASGATLNVSSGSNNAISYGTNARWVVAGTLIQSNSGHVLTIPGNITLNGGTLASSLTNGSGYGAYFGGSTGAGYATTIAANGSGNSITAVNFGQDGVMTLSTPQAGDSLLSTTDFFDRGAGTSSITKTGLGTLTLGGTSTYSAGTTVSAGTLLVTNTTGSATGTGPVTISSAATLGGGGIISGTVNVSGTIAPGIANISSPAILNISGGSILSGTSVIDLTSANASDEIVFSGLGSPNFSGGTLNVVDTTGFTLAGGQTFSIFGYGSNLPAYNFSSVSLPTLSGAMAWNTSNLYTAGTISIVSTNASGTWAASGSGNWDTAGNWVNNVIATGAGQTATFGDSIGSGSATVTLIAPETVGTISFSGSQGGSYTLAGNTLTLDNSGRTALISVNAGTQTINAPITLAAGVTITTATGSTLVIGGTVSGTGGAFVTPSSTLSVAATGVISVPLYVAGNTTFANNSGGFTYLSRTLPSLSINSGGAVALQAGAQNTRQLLAISSSISIGTTGLLDLTNNDLLLQAGGNTGLTQISSLIAQAYSGGSWQGTGGITSSSAAANSTHLTTLGVILNDDGTGTNNPIYTSFDGAQTADGDVLVKYTYYGDANLDGKVDGSDYSLIDNGYLNQLTGWFNGDFNYDGVVDGSDYTLIDNAFNTQGTQLSADIAGPTAIATSQIAGGTSSVPEAGNMSVLIIGSLALLARRRRLGVCAPV